jgi:hypothetical protein
MYNCPRDTLTHDRSQEVSHFFPTPFFLTSSTTSASDLFFPGSGLDFVPSNCGLHACNLPPISVGDNSSKNPYSTDIVIARQLVTHRRPRCHVTLLAPPLSPKQTTKSKSRTGRALTLSCNPLRGSFFDCPTQTMIMQ